MIPSENADPFFKVIFRTSHTILQHFKSTADEIVQFETNLFTNLH